MNLVAELGSDCELECSSNAPDSTDHNPLEHVGFHLVIAEREVWSLFVVFKHIGDSFSDESKHSLKHSDLGEAHDMVLSRCPLQRLCDESISDKESLDALCSNFPHMSSRDVFT